MTLKHFTRFLAAIACMVLASYASAQNYHPLLRTDVMWEVHNINPDAFGVAIYPSWITIDTNNNLNANGHQYSFLNGLYLREDPVLRHVYEYNLGSGTESLLYDFTMEVGDSIDARLLGGGMESAKQWVVSKDMVEVDGQQRNRWFFDSPTTLCQLWWIEGIGSNRGPTRTHEYDCWHTFYAFQCYRLRDAPFNESIYGNLCTPVNIEELPKQNLELLPNPANAELTVRLPQPATQLRIYTISGSLVETVPGGGSSTSHRLQTAQYPEGLYLLEAETAAGNVREKFLVVH